MEQILFQLIPILNFLLHYTPLKNINILTEGHTKVHDEIRTLFCTISCLTEIYSLILQILA